MKRFLSFLLAFVMVLSMVPVSILTAQEVSAEPVSILGSSPSTHTHDSTWTAWDGTTIASMKDGGKYYLTKDAVTGTNYVQNANVTVCLNGHSLTTADGQRMFRGDGTTSSLTICDCQAKFDSNGNLISENNLTPSNLYGSVVVLRAANGSLTMHNVVVDGKKDDNSGYVSNGNGGLAIGTWNANSTIKLEDCVIRNCHTTTHGGAIYLSSGGGIEANRVLFQNNYSGGSNGGGAICAPSSIKQLKLTGCTFDGNTAAVTGGAISHFSGSAQIENCTFKNNKATGTTGKGGALNLYNAAAVTGCTFTGNEANDGSAIYIGKNNASPAAFTIENCTVQGNTAKNTAAVYVKLGNLTVKGDTKITGNTAGDLYLAANQKLALGAMGANAQINVATEADTTDANTFMAWASSVTPADTFDTKVLYTNPEPDKIVGYKANNFVLNEQKETILTSSPSEHDHNHPASEGWIAWDGTTIAAMQDGGKYYLTKDAATGTNYINNADVTVCLNGHSLTAVDGQRVFRGGGAKSYLTVCDCQAKFDSDGNLISENNLTPSNQFGGVYISNSSDGKLIMENVIIDGMKDDGSGYVANGNGGLALATWNAPLTYTLENVVIRNCHSTGLGGAVAMTHGGVLKTNRVVFQNNKSTQFGGAIYLTHNSNELHLKNTTFDGNQADQGGGAIVQYTNTSKIFAEKVTFKNNKVTGSTAYGGGVILARGGTPTMELTECTFNANESTNEGGAILTNRLVTATLKDCTFTANKSAKEGGAVRFCQGTVNMEDCTFTGNQTTTTGRDGSAIWTNVPLSLKNCQITGNTAAGNCAVYTSAALTVSGNTKIADNTATDAKFADAYLAGSKMNLGDMTDGFQINVGNATEAADPDEFLTWASGATPVVTEDLKVTYTKPDTAKKVGYNATDLFFFEGSLTPPPPVTTHYHHDCLCAITGFDCGVNHGSEPEQAWFAWGDNAGEETSLPTAAGNYYLTKKITLAADATIGADVKICLNGFDIDLNQKTINNQGNLTIMNCKATLNAKNQLTSENGKLYNGYRNGEGGAIRSTSSTGSTTLLGVLVTGNTGKGSDSRTGGALYLENGTTTIKSCKFTNNQALSSTGAAGRGSGGAISMYYKASAHITDTVFDGNHAQLWGGAIMVTNRDANLDTGLTVDGNCEFINNTSDNEGSAIYVGSWNANYKLKVILGGNTVISNNTSGGSSAVYLRKISGIAPVVTVKDSVKIQSNTNGEDLFVNTGCMLTVGALNADAKVNVATPAVVGDPDSFLVKAEGLSLADTTDTHIVYANNGKTVAYKAAKLFYFDSGLPAHEHYDCACVIDGSSCDHGTAPVAEWEPWGDDEAEKTSLPTAEGYYYLTQDIDLTKAAGSGKSYDVATGVNVSLCMNGKNIKCDQNNKLTHAYMVNGGSLTIMNCQAKLDANKQLDKEQTVGGKITGASGTRTVLRTYGKAKMNLIGIELSDNEVYSVNSNHGGALLIEGGTANVKYCRFADNYSDMLGGAIALNAWYVDAPVLNAENTVFENNESRVDGGAISTYGGPNATGCTVNVKNCIFEGNKSEQGGAINLFRPGNTGANAVFSMSIDGCTFTGNEATSDGGAVASYGVAGKNNTVTIKNTKFTGNTADKAYGGALAVQNTDLTVSGSTLQGNVAGNGGGAIHAHDANVTVENSVLTENKTVKAGGGAIYTNVTPELLGQKQASLKVTGSTLSDNTVEQEAGDGGAIRAYRGTDVVLENNKITGNKAGYGSAISLQNKSTLLLKSGEISGNEALKDGAVYVVGVTMTMTGGEIKNNKADRYSGAIAIANGGEVIFSGNPVVYNNTAALGSNILIRNADDKVTIGQLGDKAMIGIATSVGTEVTDPDDFLKVQKDVTLMDAEYIGVLCDTYLPAKQVGYSNDKNVQFYFTNVTVGEHKDHGACACVLTGDTCAHEAVKWEPWPYTDRLPVLEGNYYLTADVNLTKEKGSGKTIQVAGNRNVKLCLNGKNITCDQNNELEAAYFAYNGQITIMNCCAKLDANKHLDAATTVGGKITGAKGARAGALRTFGNAKLTLIGVELSGNEVITNKNSNMGGALLAEGGEINIQYCRFANNKSYRMGGAIQINAYVEDPATVTVENTIFEGNETPVRGGAIGVYMGGKTGKSFDLTVKNCLFKDNTSKEGGAIGTQRDGDTPKEVVFTLNVEGCTFVENNATENGGAIYLMGRPDNMNVVNVKNTTFTGNTANQGAAMHFVQSKVTGDGVVMEKGVAPKGGGAFYAQQSDVKFANSEFNENKEGKSGGAAIYMNNTCKLQLDKCKISKNIGHAQGDGAGVRLWRSTDAVMNNCVFDGNEGAYGAAISVLRGSTLELNGCTFTNNKASRNGGAVMSNWMTSKDEPCEQPVIEVNDCTFTGNYARYNGGAISVKQGTLIFNSGKVANNTVKEAGGGIAVESVKDTAKRAVFKFNGGSIVNNEARNGGGLFVGVEADMYQYGGYVAYNHVLAGGGGIYINADGSGYFYGGTYQGNSCDDSGAGIHTSGGNIYMYGATVKENKSKYWGGGIRVWTDGYMLMEGGTVENNEAGWAGGGLYINGDTDIKGGKIINNKIDPTLGTAETNFRGGGICLHDGKGSIYVQRFIDLNISGGEISGNYTPQYGGGIYMNGRGKVTMTGGVIKDNTAGELGGGVMVDNLKHFRASKSILRLIDGEISGNSAVNGGGVYTRLCAYPEFLGGTIKGNTATETGGGLYLDRGTVAQLKNVLITENKAAKGAGMYFMDDTVMESVTVTGNESGDGYAVYLEKNDYDGESYVMGTIKMSGNMIVADNKGAKPDMFIAKGSQIVVNNDGMGKDTLMNIDLEEGVLTSTILGAYNYEGGNLSYTLTYGDRSVKDVEVYVPSGEDTQPEETTEPTADAGEDEGSFSIGGIVAISAALVAAVIAILVAVAVKKKKKADSAAKESVQE